MLQTFRSVSVQLALEQHRFELCKWTYIYVDFFQQEILQYYTIRGWLIRGHSGTTCSED